MPGNTVIFEGEHGEKLQAVVPPGRKAGQAFHVAPPVTMLCIPEGAIAGDQLIFKVPSDLQAPKGQRVFQERSATVPPNLLPGQYFSVMLCDTPPQQHDVELVEV